MKPKVSKKSMTCYISRANQVVANKSCKVNSLSLGIISIQLFVCLGLSVQELINRTRAIRFLEKTSRLIRKVKTIEAMWGELRRTSRGKPNNIGHSRTRLTNISFPALFLLQTREEKDTQRSLSFIAILYLLRFYYEYIVWSKFGGIFFIYFIFFHGVFMMYSVLLSYSICRTLSFVRQIKIHEYICRHFCGKWTRDENHPLQGIWKKPFAMEFQIRDNNLIFNVNLN